MNTQLIKRKCLKDSNATLQMRINYNYNLYKTPFKKVHLNNISNHLRYMTTGAIVAI